MIMTAQGLGYSVLEKGMSSWQVGARLEITSPRRGQLERVNARAMGGGRNALALEAQRSLVCLLSLASCAVAQGATFNILCFLIALTSFHSVSEVRLLSFS